MARPNKIGLDYFPLDVDMLESDKIRPVIGQYGPDSIYILLRLLCDIYKHCYFIEWNARTKYCMLTKLNGITEGKVDAVVKELLDNGFFDKMLFIEKGVLTSANIQAIFFTATKRRTKQQEWKYLLVDAGDGANKSDKNCIQKPEFLLAETQLTQTEMTESKVKESKEKEEEKKKSLKEKLNEMWPTLSMDKQRQIVHLNTALMNLGIQDEKQRIQIVFASNFGELGGKVWEYIAFLRANGKVNEKGIYILRCLKNDKRDHYEM